MATVTPQERHEKMTRTKIPKLVTSLAIPAMVSQVVNLIYNSADTFFVGMLSNSASAAVGVNLPLSSFIAALGCGFAMGASSLISRRLGGKDNDAANLYGSSACFINCAVGLLLTVLGLLLLQPLMRLFGSTESLLPESMAYARYVLLAAPFYCLEWALNVILRAEGSATFAMIGIASGCLLNVALDPIFIFTFGMGTAGAALATAISQVLSCVVLAIPFLRKKTIVRLRLRYVSRRVSDYVLLLKTGIPTVFRQGLATVAMALLNNQTKAYSITAATAAGLDTAAADVAAEVAIAGISIANKLYMWVRNLVLGIGQGFQPVAGYNYGDHRNDRVKEAFRFTCIIGTALCTAAAALMAITPEALITVFRDDPEVVAVGTRALRMYAVVLPLLGFSTYVNQMYQCLGFAGQATFLASCRQGIFFVPLALLLPWLFGMAGICTIQPAADLATALASLPFVIVFFRRILPKNTLAPTEKV